MTEAVEVDFAQLESCEDVASAAMLWASRNPTPTWNGWVSLMAQLRRYFPEDPAHADLAGSGPVTCFTG